MVLKQEKIVDVGDDRNYVDFDEASEAAVERWLTSPASSSRNSCMTTSPRNSSMLGGRHSHTGAFNSSDLDSVTRSMSVAAASALIQANEAVSSPGGQFGNKTSQSAPGRNILRERNILVNNAEFWSATKQTQLKHKIPSIARYLE